MKGAVVRGPRALHSWSPARAFLLVAVVLLAHWLTAPSSRPTVLIYGDSLTVQSEDAARRLNTNPREALVFQARAGTAMCDWIDQASFDRLALHPARVVLAFTGNTASCASEAFRTGGVAGAVALYEQSLRQMRTIFASEPITIVIPPAMHNLPNGWFPFNGDPALVAMYKRVGTELHMSINTSADDWLTPGHVYTPQRPAYPNGPLVDVRLSDGVHLSVAGELWYGAALLQRPGAVPHRAPDAVPSPEAGPHADASGQAAGS